MIIAALVAFGALLACWLVAASEPDVERHAAVVDAGADAAAAELVRAA